MIRFPKECLRCGRSGHLAKDCPLGKSQQERDLDAMLRRDTSVIVVAGLLVVLAMILFGVLERVPT